MDRIRAFQQLTGGLLAVVLGLALLVAPAWALTAQSVTLQTNKTTVDNCTVVADCPLVDVKGFTTVVFQVLGTFTGSVQFEAAVNKNLGFTSLECFSAANRSSSTTAVTSPGAWRCNVIGFNFARPRIDTLTSGSVSIVAGIVSAGVL